MKRALVSMITAARQACRQRADDILIVDVHMPVRTLSIGLLSKVCGAGSGADTPKGTWSASIVTV